RATGAQGFGEQDRNTAVEQARGLLGPLVDRHPRPDEIVADFEELEADALGGGLVVGRGQDFDRERSLPDAHACTPGRLARPPPRSIAQVCQRLPEFAAATAGQDGPRLGRTGPGRRRSLLANGPWTASRGA